MIKNFFKRIVFIIFCMIFFSKAIVFGSEVNINKRVYDGDMEAGNYLVAEYRTEYNEFNLNRSTNIKIASSKINGLVILPGEIFSFNTVVGNRTMEAGFKMATVYQNGKITNGFGGGVCQVSSTLYNAVLYANLMIIERKGHLFLPSYVSSGRDATVADEYIDFKFKNTRQYPITIVSEADNGLLKIKIYGQRQKEECSVELQTVVKEYTPYNIVYEENADMTSNDMCVGQKGRNGCKGMTYKILRVNGEVLAKTIVSKDVYRPINEVRNIATKY